MPKTPIEQIDDVTAVAASDGNWNCNPYMMGMANGLLLAQHIMHERHGDVPYKTAPDQWLDDKPRPLNADAVSESASDAQ